MQSQLSIPFSKSPITVNSEKYIKQALEQKTSGDGEFTKKCSSWLEKQFSITKAMLTTSCSHALDMAAYLCDIKEGDEVIMSSFTFSSTANAFVQHGAKIVFVDIRPDTMNIDETLIEAAISDKTFAIVLMHYAGVGCEVNTIIDIAKKHNLLIIEDAAHAIMSRYNGKALGTFGDFGCFSFHDTKNYSMGEGGALLIRDPKHIRNAEIIREKGTNRSRFYRGEIDKYSWVDWGSSYLPSEINAAYLWSQLEIAEEINKARIAIWNNYYEMLATLADKGYLELPSIPKNCIHNAHIFYFKVTSSEVQANLLEFLKNRSIGAVFHYVPLHSSEAGQKFGVFRGDDKYTTKESSRLIRLPLYYGLTKSEIERITENIYNFFIKAKV